MANQRTGDQQPPKETQTLYCLNMESFFMGETEISHILDHQFFNSKKEAIQYGTIYLDNLVKKLFGEIIGEVEVIREDRVQISTDDFWCTIQVDELTTYKEQSTEDKQEPCYISYFSTLYYLDGDEVIEPDEMRIKHILDGRLFFRYSEALNYIIHLIESLELNKCHLRFEEGVITIYGTYDASTGYEYRYTVNKVPDTSPINLYTSQSNECNNHNTKDLFSKHVKSKINHLADRYQNKSVYQLLKGCREDFDLYY